MKNSILLIFGMWIAEACGNIAYTAKFLGNMKVAGDSQLVYALSLTHCLALCNKDADCDAITFEDDKNKCQLFKRCAPMQLQNASSHYLFYARRPPISSEGYVYEKHTNSCIKLTDIEVEYKDAAKVCAKDNAFLSSLENPELLSFVSQLMLEKNKKDAWVNQRYGQEIHSSNHKRRVLKRPRRRLKRGACRILLPYYPMVQTTLSPFCLTDKKISICQIPIY